MESGIFLKCHHLWNLPLLLLQAAVAGCVVVCTGDEGINNTKLSKIKLGVRFPSQLIAS